MDNKNISSEDQVDVTINKRINFMHFSDGVEEVVEEQKVNALQSSPGQQEVDPKILSWGPWFSHYAWKTGSKMLGAIDYAGEGLSSFFGITTPKYQIEVSEYERKQEEKKQMEEESAGWVPKNGDGNIPLVMEEPSKDVEKANV